MDNQDIISYDVLIVGAGPAGLATAISLADKLKQNLQNHNYLGFGVVPNNLYLYIREDTNPMDDLFYLSQKTSIQNMNL